MLKGTYLKRILIAQIEHEYVSVRASQTIVAEICPFEMRADREIGDRGQIRDLQFVQSICEYHTGVKCFSPSSWSVLLSEFAPYELLQCRKNDESLNKKHFEPENFNFHENLCEYRVLYSIL